MGKIKNIVKKWEKREIKKGKKLPKLTVNQLIKNLRP